MFAWHMPQRGETKRRTSRATLANASVLEIEHPKYNSGVSFRETLPNGFAVRRLKYLVKKGEAAAFAAEKGAEIGNHGAIHATVEDDERAALKKFRTRAAMRPDVPPLSALIEKAIAAHETARPPLTVSEAMVKIGRAHV